MNDTYCSTPYSFRHNAIKNLLAEAAKFDKATLYDGYPY